MSPSGTLASGSEWAPASRLEEGLREMRGGPGIARIVRRPSAYASSAALSELDLTLRDGSELHLLHKGTLAAGPDRGAVRPSFTRDPLREMAVYRSVLAVDPVRAPELHATVTDPESPDFGIFIERVRGKELWQFADPEPWHATARWLAGFHGRYQARAHALVGRARLAIHDAAYHRVWMRRALELAGDRSSAAYDPERLAAVRSVAERHDTVVAELLRVPATLIHGELYPSNVLIRDGVEPARGVCPVDWETAAVGPCLTDLAALTSGAWDPGRRAGIVAAYSGELEDRGWWTPTPGELERGLTACRVQQAIQWLGWSADWTPPVEHAHDWLGEAVGLARELDGR